MFPRVLARATLGLAVASTFAGRARAEVVASKEAAGSPDVETPSLASALSPPPAPVAVRRPGTLPAHVVAVNFGLASAVGVAGVTYMYAGLAPLELEVGLGEGHSGVLVSAMGKLSLGTEAHRFVAGAGVANTVIAGSEVHGHPLWLNLDLVGYEYRKAHLFLAAAAGYTTLLSGTAWCSRGIACPAGSEGFSEAGPQFRVLMGTTF